MRGFFNAFSLMPLVLLDLVAQEAKEHFLFFVHRYYLNAVALLVVKALAELQLQQLQQVAVEEAPFLFLTVPY